MTSNGNLIYHGVTKIYTAGNLLNYTKTLMEKTFKTQKTVQYIVGGDIHR